MYDTYCVLREKIPNLYPMKVCRCLRRYGLDILLEEFIKEERKFKKFKKYKICYLHSDTLYIPKMNQMRHYILTCIDRVSKLAYAMVVKNKTMANSKIFLDKVLKFYPYRINCILTDNIVLFKLCFVKLCQGNKIKQRAIKFRHP